MKLEMTYAGLMSFEHGEEPSGLPSINDLEILAQRALDAVAQDGQPELQKTQAVCAIDDHNDTAS